MTNWETRTSMLSYVFGIVLAGTTTHEAASFEFDKFSAAANYCSNYKNSIKLSEDRTILCFDGRITADRDVAAFSELKQNGFFVIRSPGGFAPVGIILSNILLEKNATVIVYDYCLSACANYFLIASSTTYVTKNTVVAWHGGSPKNLLWNRRYRAHAKILSRYASSTGQSSSRGSLQDGRIVRRIL